MILSSLKYENPKQRIRKCVSFGKGQIADSENTFFAPHPLVDLPGRGRLRIDPVPNILSSSA